MRFNGISSLSILSWTLVVSLNGLPSFASSNESFYASAAKGPFDCKNLKAGNYQFDLSPINFPVEIIDTEVTPPSTTKTSITIDLCSPLSDTGSSDEQCSDGTRVCMKVVNEKKGESDRVTQVISSGGTEFESGGWQAQLGDKLQDSERVLELEMAGDYYGVRKQRTEIDFKCDKTAQKDAKPTLKKYDRSEGKLKLEWITPHACATRMGGAGEDDPQNDHSGNNGGEGGDNKSSGGWGFFSWFFFLLIVGGAIYFGAGLWRNYNEYGVIELPNKDFWREAPYIAKDMGKHIYSTVSGQGSSRGAYEPV